MGTSPTCNNGQCSTVSSQIHHHFTLSSRPIMPLPTLMSSLCCTNRFKRSYHGQQPTIKGPKDCTRSDSTESGTYGDRTTSQETSQDLSTMGLDTEHTITLSLLDQGMPRHYTRFCLAFSLGGQSASEAVTRLEAFLRRTFQAEPWLAGYVCPVKGDAAPKDQLAIRFSQRDVENFKVKVQELGPDRFALTYDELCDLGMPPSKIPRHVVSTCPNRRPDTEPSVVLDITVNVIRGGLLVAIFLHHGVSDGASMGTIISGRSCRNVSQVRPLTEIEMAEKARAESRTRRPLSFIPPNQSIGMHVEYKPALRAVGQTPAAPAPAPSPSEVTSHIFVFSEQTLHTLKADLNALVRSSGRPEIRWISTHDALQSLLWQHLTRARIPSLTLTSTRPLPPSSTLLIPVNIRNRITPPLPATYLGSAVALAPASLPLASLMPATETHNVRVGTVPGPANKAYLLPSAVAIHAAIARCNDSYVREVLALTQRQTSVRNMVDLNVDTAGGLDLCITSWAVLPIFEEAAPDGEGGGGGGSGSDLGMGLGVPDYVRKPWSRDAGGCIILPRDRRRGQMGDGGAGGLEVVVQLKTPDMERLMQDGQFMGYVDRVID